MTNLSCDNCGCLESSHETSAYRGSKPRSCLSCRHCLGFYTVRKPVVEQPPTLILTIGLPRSGKSTWARSTGHPVVNPDSVRLALYGERYKSEAEPMVWTITRYMITALFIAGNQTIVLDATNTTRARRDEWQGGPWKLVYKHFATSLDVCLGRAVTDGREDLIPVIERMNRWYESPDEHEQANSLDTQF